MQKLFEEQRLTATQQISHNESKEFRDRQNMFNPPQYKAGGGGSQRHQFSEYMFELERDEEADFGVSLPVAQQVAFYIYSYSNKNGVYSLTDKITDDPPPYVYVL
jgi:hypothetical protein